jgi:inorganic triphosphatase YgiF
VSAGIEIEAKLRVRAGSGRAVFERISRLRELAGCQLEDAGALSQRDLYWDTPRAELRAQRAALRLRWVGTHPVPRVALKRDEASPREAIELSARSEWERPWSATAAVELARELAALGLRSTRAAPTRAEDPEAALRALGFEALQSRATRRQILAAISQEGTAVAEIALDRVEFRVGAIAVCHFEVEIEALAPESSRARVDSLCAALQRAIGTDLLPWTPNKLVLGLALAELADRPGALALDAEGVPDEASYARLAALAAERWRA